MEFFCTKCKRKHSADKIGFNLWEICREKTADNVVNLLGEQYRDLGEGIAKWCREPESKDSFVFVGEELLSRVASDRSQPEGQTIVRGNFRLTLNWLLDAYQKAKKLKEMPSFDRALLETPVYSGFMKASYDLVGDQKVLTSIQDKNDDPFTTLVTTEETDERGLITTRTELVKLGFQRCCPQGHPLSQAVGKAREYVIALAGSPRAGKTSCITAIMRGLRDGLYQKDYELSMLPFNDDPQWNKLKKEIDLFRDGWAITKTETKDRELTYSILVKVGGAKRVLTFVDMPGEFWQQDGSGFTKEWYTEYAGIYENLDCIWFFISKWTAYGDTATKLGQQELKQLEEISAETAATVRDGDAGNLNANFESLRTLLSNAKRRMPPIAVVLTKGDVPITSEDWKDAKEYDLFPVRGGTLAMPDDVSSANNRELKRVLTHSDRNNQLILNEHEYWRSSNRTRQFFRQVSSGALSVAIEQNFPRRTYISMAAYGHAAPRVPNTSSLEDDSIETVKRTETNIQPTPFREMFPLIWTFAVMGALPVRHHCEYYKENLLRSIKLIRSEEREETFSYRQMDRLHRDQELAKRENRLKQFNKDTPSEKLMIMEDIGNNLLTDTDVDGANRYTITKIIMGKDR